MARSTSVVVVRAAPERVWEALVDWPSHGRWAPLTSVRVEPGRAAGVGARFTGRTGLGPLAFDDPMEVVVWQPPSGGRPGRCEVVKQGRVVLGRAWFDVVGLPDGRTRVAWHEDVDVAPVRLTRLASPLTALAGRVLFGLVLRRMAREVAARG